MPFIYYLPLNLAFSPNPQFFNWMSYGNWIIINNHLSNYRFLAHCISLNNILWVWQHQSWFMLFAITKPLFMSRSNPENWATTELHPGYRRFPCPWSYFSVARFVQTPIKWLYQFQAIHLNTFFVCN